MKILLVTQTYDTWVERDVAILREEHDVRVVSVLSTRDLLGVYKNMPWCDIVFSWFGKFPAFHAVLLSRLLGKRAVVVSGGDDAASVPEIRYGMYYYWWKRWCPSFVFRSADLVLSVSECNRLETTRNSGVDPSKVKLLYHGFEPDKLLASPKINKEEMVLTVGGVDWERVRRKGYEGFVRSALHLPKAEFVLVGEWCDSSVHYLQALAPPNVRFTGGVSTPDLMSWFGRSKVYVQASLHEGFGCTVAEAMLCECVPVVSRRTSLPEVVGDCGFYVDDLRPQEIAAQIQRALASDLGQRARERILIEFPFQRRKEGLLRAIADLGN